MITALVICACGLLGMLAVIETALYYAGVDALAFNITLLMGAVLIGGVLELLWVSRRTLRLAGELSAFPRSATYAHVEGASPLLRSLLSARLDRTALPVPGPVFTPFILSLLVMLGLLGTFLGLFETLRGAGYALDASADVEALRNGLKAPISGLMRSFGTSAAGVASSALLGLAAVFVRRDGGHFGVALHAAATGDLARYAPARRQLVALETLAEQGSAWPTAATALQQAVARLDGLGESWKATHAESAQHTRAQLASATDGIREAIRAGVDRAASESSALMTPLLEGLVQNTGEAAAAHLASLQAQLERWTRERAQSDTALLDSVRSRMESLDALERARGTEASERHAALSAQLTGTQASLLAQIAAAEEARSELFARTEQERGEFLVRTEAERIERFASTEQARNELSARTEQERNELFARTEQERSELFARTEQERSELLASTEKTRTEQLVESEHTRTSRFAQAEQARADALLEGWQALVAKRAELDAQLLSRLQQELEAVHAQERARAEALADRFESLADGVQRAFAGAAERDEQRAASLGEVGVRMQQDLSEAASVVRERLTHSAESEARLQQRAEQLFERLSEASQVIAASAETQAGALSEFVAATDGRIRQAEQTSQARLGEVLAEWSALGKAQGERMAAFEQSLLGQHESSVERLGARLGEHAQTLDAHLAESAELLQQAATLVHGGGAELSAVAESFASAVASQREGARQWLESLGDIERYALESGEAAAADALGQHLARTHEVFDRQLQFQQELIEQLHGMRRRDSMVVPRADVGS